MATRCLWAGPGLAGTGRTRCLRARAGLAGTLRRGLARSGTLAGPGDPPGGATGRRTGRSLAGARDLTGGADDPGRTACHRPGATGNRGRADALATGHDRRHDGGCPDGRPSGTGGGTGTTATGGIGAASAARAGCAAAADGSGAGLVVGVGYAVLTARATGGREGAAVLPRVGTAVPATGLRGVGGGTRGSCRSGVAGAEGLSFGARYSGHRTAGPAGLMQGACTGAEAADLVGCGMTTGRRLRCGMPAAGGTGLFRRGVAAPAGSRVRPALVRLVGTGTPAAASTGLAGTKRAGTGLAGTGLAGTKRAGTGPASTGPASTERAFTGPAGTGLRNESTLLGAASAGRPGLGGRIRTIAGFLVPRGPARGRDLGTRRGDCGGRSGRAAATGRRSGRAAASGGRSGRSRRGGRRRPGRLCGGPGG
jgi:hypothetical protein